MFRHVVTTAIALCMLAITSTSNATAILADGSWHEFGFNGVGSFATSGVGKVATVNPVAEQISTPPWTFSGLGVVTVLDLFNIGDRFELFDNNVSLGLTSVPGTGGCGNDIAACLATADNSKGVFNLGLGAHSLTIQVTASPFGSGAAAFQVSAAAVPEPQVLLLLATGLLGLGFSRRKQA